MKILALFYQNPAGYLTSLLLLVFSAVSFAINNNTAWIFLVAFVFVLIANILYSVLSFKATRKYIKEVNKSLSQEKISNVDSFPLPCVMCDKKGNIVSSDGDVTYTLDYPTMKIKDDTYTFNDRVSFEIKGAGIVYYKK